MTEPDFAAEMESLAARRLAAIPALGAFTEHLRTTICVGRREQLALAAEALRALMSSDVLTQLVNFELGLMAKHGYYVPPSRFGAQMALTSVDGWELSISSGRAFANAGAACVSTHERDVILGNVYGAPIPYSRYAINGIVRVDVLNRSATLDPVEHRSLVAGDVLVIDSELETLDIDVRSGNLIVSLAGPILRPYVWEFDRTRLTASRLVTADINSSRIAYAPELLVHLESTESVPLLVDLSTHPLHFVRWNAIKAVCALDPCLGLDALKKAIHDDHPHVRRAAEASLNRYQQQTEVA